MHTIRKTMIMIVINIFLLVMADLFSEFFVIKSKLLLVEQTIQRSVDSAVQSSFTAEELFGDSKASILSYDNLNNRSATTLVWTTDVGLRSANQYYLALYLSKTGKNVYELTSTDINNLTSDTTNYNVRTVYSFLYGKIGADASAVSWAVPKSKRGYYSGYSPDRTPNANFLAYYLNMGSHMAGSVNLKEKKSTIITKPNGSSATKIFYDLKKVSVPILDQMGLWLDDTYNGTSAYSPSVTNEKYIATVKRSSYGDGYYFLTPYSLGVTYLPIEVLKPLVVNNLNVVARMHYLDSLSFANQAEATTSMQRATGCLSTRVYGNAGGAQTPHSKGGVANNALVSDGNVEYDLSSVKVKVDYFCFNYRTAYTNNKLAKALTVIDGCESSYNYTNDGSNPTPKASAGMSIWQQTAYNLAQADSAQSYYSGTVGDTSFVVGNKIIAKVTVRVKVHICYTSPILQWACKRYSGGSTSEHYDVKMVDPATGTVIKGDDLDTDGVWYQYSTYIGVTR